MRRLFHTVRHLRAEQVAFRAWRRLYTPRPDGRPPPPVVDCKGEWVAPARRRPVLVGAARVRLLGMEHALDLPGDWSTRAHGLLWLYNLHYFDDLNAHEAPSRRQWQRALIARWLQDNPPARGAGWDPYPVSLRIVNWIKAHWDGFALGDPAVESLAVQTRWVAANLERHLLGNHLVANAKALLFAGCFFAGTESRDWERKGRELLARELPEQLLPDGGHFERSPMYQQIVLEDLLDVVNALRRAQRRVPEAWETAVGPMQTWLATMCHPGGRIGLFNDAAFGVTPRPQELVAYAERLGLAAAPVSEHETRHLADSGYLRLANRQAVALLDVAPLGPDYLPAHGHADTLTFELSVARRRLIVDSGTSVYEPGPERLRQRGTRAHNTLLIDGEDSSEVWAGFRVARRARVTDVLVDPGAARVCASHDGYTRLRGRPVHRRCWHLAGDALCVHDRVEGTRRHQIEVNFYFHPGLTLARVQPHMFAIRGSGGEQVARVCGDPGLEWQVAPATYHPEFGVSLPNQRLVGTTQALLPWRGETRIEWANAATG